METDKDIKKNYMPDSISFASGFMGPKGDVGFIMKYDHGKALKIIEDLLSSGRKISEATAGLDGDWRENSSTIYEDGQLVKDFYEFYQTSCWATPILMVFFEDAPSERHEVWEKIERKEGDYVPKIAPLGWFE